MNTVQILNALTAMSPMVIGGRASEVADHRWLLSAANSHEIRANNTLSQKGLRKRKRQMIGRGVK